MKRWIGDLPLSRKFALIFVLSLAMMALPATLAVRGQLKVLDSARAEASGTAPAGDLLKLLRLSQQHRGLSALALAGNAEAPAKRQAKQAEVDQALQAVQQTATAMQHPRVDQRLAGVVADWKALSTAVASASLKGPESFARHTALIENMLELLDDIVDTSTLALDPEAATYYLVMASLHHAPQLTETLGQLRARGSALLALGKTTAEDRIRIASLVDSAHIHAKSVRAAMERALEASDEMKLNLAEPSGQAAAAANKAMRLASEKLLGEELVAMPAVDYFAQLTQGIDAQFTLIDADFKMLDAALADRVVAAQRELLLVTGSIAVFAALTLWVIMLVARGTTATMRQALQVARTVAEGDLSSNIESGNRDEAGQLMAALKTMNDSLRSLVRQVRLSSDSIATGSAQIAGGNADLSQRTEEQASSLQRTAAAMDQLTTTVQRNADTARQANQLAAQTRGAAQQGGLVMGQVVGTMQDISASSSRIADIIGVIDGIAFQTNILALNAAVEAARAGEQGRGFAVVASEVRTLAQRSAQAAREIKQLIQLSVDKVEAGSRLVDDAGRSMQDIVGQVAHVAELIAEISTASSEQNQGIAEVGGAVQGLDHMTQENAALVEQSAAAAESLSQQAGKLSEVVSVFRLEAAGSPAM